MEFLGDTVLQLVVSEFLYKHFPDHHEGHLSVSLKKFGFEKIRPSNQCLKFLRDTVLQIVASGVSLQIFRELSCGLSFCEFFIFFFKSLFIVSFSLPTSNQRSLGQGSKMIISVPNFMKVKM